MALHSILMNKANSQHKILTKDEKDYIKKGLTVYIIKKQQFFAESIFGKMSQAKGIDYEGKGRIPEWEDAYYDM